MDRISGPVGMEDKNDRVSTSLALIVVFWPAGLWLIGFFVAQLARLNGCKIWARGPEECLFLGMNVGENIYPIWSLGVYLMGVFLWIPIGLILLGVIRFIRRAT
jgi:hypothetical protein